jgi:hypothetical protein
MSLYLDLYRVLDEFFQYNLEFAREFVKLEMSALSYRMLIEWLWFIQIIIK